MIYSMVYIKCTLCGSPQRYEPRRRYEVSHLKKYHRIKDKTTIARLLSVATITPYLQDRRNLNSPEYAHVILNHLKTLDHTNECVVEELLKS